jgi:hypothetical protein
MQGAEFDMCRGIAPHLLMNVNAFLHSQMGSNLSGHGQVMA